MLYQSLILSFGIQTTVLLIDIYGLNIKIPKDKLLFNQLLKMELGVQLVEMIFYVFIIYNFSSINNITPKRYYDWVITTPIMLVTLIAYLDSDSRQYKDIFEFISTHKTILKKIVVANLAMLSFGLLGEYGIINLAIYLGFIPFIYYFYLIYQHYIEDKKEAKDKKPLYWFFFVVWALYGISAFLPYVLKNTAYNILDIFSKNGFGVFLVYVIWTNRIK